MTIKQPKKTKLEKIKKTAIKKKSTRHTKRKGPTGAQLEECIKKNLCASPAEIKTCKLRDKKVLNEYPHTRVHNNKKGSIRSTPFEQALDRCRHQTVKFNGKTWRIIGGNIDGMKKGYWWREEVLDEPLATPQNSLSIDIPGSPDPHEKMRELFIDMGNRHNMKMEREYRIFPESKTRIDVVGKLGSKIAVVCEIHYHGKLESDFQKLFGAFLKFRCEIVLVVSQDEEDNIKDKVNKWKKGILVKVLKIMTWEKLLVFYEIEDFFDQFRKHNSPSVSPACES